MLRNRIYYGLKPFVPQSVRAAIRRRLATRLRGRIGEVWPIMPGSESPPENWPGWPESKKFAFVLTHDVESRAGLGKCRPLMQLEMGLGFRSSFNFVPEGRYRVPVELREELTNRGFEVGIHDLKHDGHLFASHRGFKRRAVRINAYMREWGASGFRSGFMLRNLDWLHDLDVQYDASTFDTDPFEPQPDAGHTIFPFWVPRQNGSSINGQPSTGNSSSDGYVELPYTLPQDSTLFLVLRETSPEIWMRKVDWIAKQGGMVLLDAHPDYMSFSNSRQTTKEYPVALYREFLTYVKSTYAGQYWQPLPKDVANHVTRIYSAAARAYQGSAIASLRTPRLFGKRAAVLLYSYYPADPRPKRAAEALVDAGMEVDVICLLGSAADKARALIHGVNVLRLPLQKRRHSKPTYILQYAAFLAACFGLLSERSVKKRYDLVHVHNMPDILVFAALVPKLLGARVILDLHDPMPELMMSIYNLGAQTPFVRWLRRFEKSSIAFADLVLTPNKAFRELFISRGCAPEKIQIVMNSPESDIFKSTDYKQSLGEWRNGVRPFKIMYHGLIAKRHGLETALDAIAKLKPVIPSLEFHIFGNDTAYMEKVTARVSELGLQNCVRYHGYQPQSEIAKSISSVDLGIIPNRRTPFTEINMPTRIFEYLAMGKPVIVPDTRGIRDYFEPASAIFFEPDNVASLRDTILDIYRNPEKAEIAVARGRTIYEMNRWETHRAQFLDRIGVLLSAEASQRKR